MPLFLIVFFLIYGGAHGYFLWKVHAALPALGRWPMAALAVFCLLMLAGPIAVRQLDAAGHARLAGAAGLVCYVWLAMLWWFTVLSLTCDAWNLLARGTSLVWPMARAAVIPARWSVGISGLLVAAAAVWGAIEAQSIRLETIEIRTPRLAAGSAPIRIVQVTDLHLGVHSGRRRLATAIRRIAEARPDVVVSTGDLIDSPLASCPELAAMMKEVEAPLGKFAVTGNHEYYLGLDKSRSFHEAAGFRLLRGASVTLDGRLVLAGVDDPAGRRTGAPYCIDEAAVLPPADGDRLPTVLLKHQPRVDPESVGRFDIQLSGHTHGGQLFPWHALTRMSYPFADGLHVLGDGRSRLYVSRGTGTWGPPMRLLAPPEVTLIILRPASDGPE